MNATLIQQIHFKMKELQNENGTIMSKTTEGYYLSSLTLGLNPDEGRDRQACYHQGRSIILVS